MESRVGRVWDCRSVLPPSVAKLATGGDDMQRKATSWIENSAHGPSHNRG